jgi:hypothetical protein
MLGKVAVLALVLAVAVAAESSFFGAVPRGWVKTRRVSADDRVPLIVAIRLKNMDKLEAILLDSTDIVVVCCRPLSLPTVLTCRFAAPPAVLCCAGLCCVVQSPTPSPRTSALTCLWMRCAL